MQKPLGFAVFFVGVLMLVGGVGGCATQPAEGSQKAFGFLMVIGLLVAGRGLDMVSSSCGQCVEEDEEDGDEEGDKNG